MKNSGEVFSNENSDAVYFLKSDQIDAWRFNNVSFRQKETLRGNSAMVWRTFWWISGANVPSQQWHSASFLLYHATWWSRKFAQISMKISFRFDLFLVEKRISEEFAKIRETSARIQNEISPWMEEMELEWMNRFNFFGTSSIWEIMFQLAVEGENSTNDFWLII